MTRYFTKPRANDDWEYSPIYNEMPYSNMTVHVEHPEYRDTGLLDACGETIYACEKVKCGFIK